MYLTQALHRSVQQERSSVMTICGDRTRSFGEVADRVARLAAGLTSLAVGGGDRVAILARNSDRYGELLLAVPWADAVLVPLNTRWSVAEIAYALDDCGAAVLALDEAFTAMLPTLRARCPGLTTVIFCGDGPAPEGVHGHDDLVAVHEPVEDVRRDDDALAGIFYTGGTTGHPKGVMLSHTNVVTSALGAVASGTLPQDPGVQLHVAPMFHLADMCAWNIQLIAGGAHVMLPSFEPDAVLATIEQHAVTSVTLVPSMIQRLVDHPAVGEYDLSSLRSVLYGGSTITTRVLERAMAVFPTASFTQAYGMTELAGLATLLGPGHHREGLLRSAGRSIPHTEVRVVDTGDRELPVGEVGEIAVRGSHVMTGYWNDPSQTSEAVREGWMHTGDVGYLDEHGFLFVVDRSKDMIVTGGENVYSAEVENALTTHPEVSACAVIGLGDPDWGERVHAVVVLVPGTSPSAEGLTEHVGSRIARYKTPRSIEFVEQLPLSATGKVLKHELRAARTGADDVGRR